MRRSVLLAYLVLSFILPVSSQYVQIGQGSYLGMIGGPIHTSAGTATYSSRFAYIYPEAVLGNLKHGDTISSLEFMRLAGTGLNSSCNMKIFLKNTSLNDFGSGILRWSAEVSGLTAVYDQNPGTDIGTSEGFQRIPFNNSVFVFDTTLGDNLELLVEYRQTAVQSNIINWYFENSGTVSGFASNQTKYITNMNLSDSLSSSSDYHPTIIFNYPRYDNDIAVLKVYTLGKLPVPLGNPDSVKVLVRNVGKKAQTGVNINTWLVGYNSAADSVKFSIGSLENKFVNLPSLNPLNKGLDTVHAGISGDQNSQNNYGVSYRLNNENVYSYRDVTLAPSAGGIGFNGQTGDFVARFFSNKSKSINQVAVQFFLTGRPFKIGIWDNSGKAGKPGKLIYLSDSLNTVAGKYILDLKKPLSVNGTFYVGVRQLNTNNVAFGYQDENPVRPNTFYYTSPYGDTNWLDFHPDAPYKFLIEPRLQGDTDLVVVSADFPKDTIDRHTTDTLAPKATVGNIGAKDMLDSFDITCEIRFYGKLVYKQVIRDTMSSGVRRSYTFPKTFYPNDFGEHELITYTSHPTDQIRDNDTARRKFYVGVKKDVMVATVFEPADNTIYEYLKDTILPVANIQNPGYDNSILFNARCRIFKGNTVVYNQTQLISLAKFNSRILIWPVYRCTDTGKLRVVFTVEMTGDAYRKNDTIVRNVAVYKSWDVGVDSVSLPDKNKFYTPKANYKPIVRLFNDGVLEAGAVTVVCRITSKYSSIVYRDTLQATVPAKDKYWVQFSRNFTPDRKGLYTIYLQTFQAGDLVKFNDSFKQNFSVGYPYDYYSKNIVYPLATDTLGVGGGPFAPKLNMGNNGYVKNADVVPVVFQVWKNNVRIYQDIKSLTLDTGGSFGLEFAKTLNPLNAGEYKMIAYTNYVSDVFKKNDTATGTFYVTVGRDAYVESITKPLSLQEFEARKDTVHVEALIRNDGKLSMSAVRTYAEIYDGTGLVYFDKVDDSLMSGEQKAVVFPKTLVPQNTGLHRLLVYTFSNQDQNIFNDTQELWFNVTKDADVKVNQWLEPLPGSVIIHNSGARTPGVELVQDGVDTAVSLSGKVYFEFHTTPGNVKVYADSALFSGLKNSAAMAVNSPSAWDFSTPGFYRATAFVNAADNFIENDTIKSFFEVRLNGLEQIGAGTLVLYPNPVQNELYILSEYPVWSAEAFDAKGARVPLIHISGNQYSTVDWAQGIYEVRVTTVKGVHTSKLIK